MNYPFRYLVAASGTFLIMGLATLGISFVWPNIPAILAIAFIALLSAGGLFLLVFNSGPAIKELSYLARRRRTIQTNIGTLLLVGSLILTVFYFLILRFSPSLLLQPGNSSGIGITTKANGEAIGISDGTFAFDVQRPGGNLKRQGADRLKSGDSQGAISFWQQDIGTDTNDAEALIYLEDQRVLASGRPYITIVVATMLTGDASVTGRYDLQGAYVAQKEFNDGFKLPNGVLVRLLIANAGSKENYATTVAQQIVQAATADKTIIGVMGWSYSTYAFNAVAVLSRPHIPMISQTASSDSLTAISPFFFRVVPPNKGQGILGAQYAEQRLKATHAALFVDPTDAYSSSLASDFKGQFTADGNTVVEEHYTVGQPSTLPALLRDALSHQVDMIYFAGHASDMGTLLTDLSPGNLPVMGGDGLYGVGIYPSSAQHNFNRLHFTAFAYPDEWGVLGLSAPAFFKEYAADFDPGASHSTSPYGYDRPDPDSMLSYDAMLALFQGTSIVSNEGKTLTPDTLRQALAQITGNQAIQGVSGQISFGADGDPINKAVVVLHVDQNNHIQIDQVIGCFLKDHC